MPGPSTDRLRMRVAFVTDFGSGITARLVPVASLDPNHENRAFSDRVPQCHLEVSVRDGCTARDLLHVGCEYNVDITLAAPRTPTP